MNLKWLYSWAMAKEPIIEEDNSISFPVGEIIRRIKAGEGFIFKVGCNTRGYRYISAEEVTRDKYYMERRLHLPSSYQDATYKILDKQTRVVYTIDYGGKDWDGEDKCNFYGADGDVEIFNEVEQKVLKNTLLGFVKNGIAELKSIKEAKKATEDEIAAAEARERRLDFNRRYNGE